MNIISWRRVYFTLASIPFRFKAGGNGNGSDSMPSSVTSHSHRSTTKVSHKAFKSRKATKGALKEISKGKLLEARNVNGY